MSYQPPQRQIRARLLTSAGWVQGTFHLPQQHSFLDFLNHGGPFLKLTEASLPDGSKQPFFALRRSAVELVVPEDETALQLHRPSGAAYRRHSIGCVFAKGTLEGTLGVLANIRVSDYLLRHDGFCVMRDCQTHADDKNRQPVVLVNTNLVIGVSQPAAEASQE